MKKITTKSLHGSQCCCTACRGLATYERPLFAAGQTLTAADLTALQSYVAGKNRLHNRFLHGWGVVCGLEVVCDDCEGSVTINPGYAIDPCGADIVVGQPTRFDVVGAIRDCLIQGRPKTGDCDPWLPPPDPGCKDALGYWCVALRYREVETAVSQRLTAGGNACVTIGKGAQAQSGSCGCGCGGGCNCGTGTAVATSAATSVAANNSCAPRRVMECFDISLIPSDEPCVPSFDKLGRSPYDDNDNDDGLGLFEWLIPPGTLLRNIIDCVLARYNAVADRVSDHDAEILGQLADDNVGSQVPLDEVHAAVCHLRAGVVGALAADAGATRCQLLRAASEVTLAPPGEQEDRALYLTQAKAALTDLIAAAMQMVLDCVCRAFLPRCAEDPCDERVEIACVTVKGGKIIAICNHSCRRYAGAFPSTFYWMSLIPLIPVISRLLAMLCCQPDLLRRNSPLVNDLVPMLRTIDPTGRLGRSVVADNFALPRQVLASLAKVSDTAVIPALVQRIERAQAKRAQEKAAMTTEAAAAAKPSSRDAAAGDCSDLREELAELRRSVAALQAQSASSARTGAKTRRKGG